MFVWPILFEAIQDILGIDETTLILGGAIAFFPVGIAFAFLVDLPAVKSFLETKALKRFLFCVEKIPISILVQKIFSRTY